MAVVAALEPWRRQLLDVVTAVQPEGNFAIAGRWERQRDTAPGLPGLAVRGVGPVSLPLSAEQRDKLVKLGQQAPYGKGAQTLQDPAVRNTVQIDASSLSFGPGWDRVIRDISDRAAKGLGVSTEFVPTTAAQPGHGPVSAHLYKLLIYPVGGHFLPHVDTEKLPGHFATLLISLPVAGGHDGGVLNVYHAGRSWSWDTSRRGVDSPHAGGEARGGSGSGGAGAGGGSRKRGRGGGGGGGGSGSAAAGHVALSRIQDEPDGELDLAVEPLDVDSLREGGDVAASKSQRLGSVSDGFRFAAFFTDCVHEITPVTAGMRVMLVYNLTRTNALPLPQHFPSSSMAPMAAAPPVAAAAGRRQQRSRQSAPGSPGGAAAGQAPGKQRQEEEQALEDARRQGDEVFRWVCEQVFDHPHAPPPVNDLQGLGERVRASVRAWEDALRAQPAAPAAPALLSRAPADAAGPSSGGSIHLGPGGEQRRVPPALVLRLEHRYSNHGLGFTQLKGRDAAVAQVLQAAGGLDLYLCLMTKWVKYTTDADEDGRILYGRVGEMEDDEDEGESEAADSEQIIDVEAYGVCTTPLLAAGGGPRMDVGQMQPGLQELLLDGGSVFKPRGEVEDTPPDARDAWYTGNEGAGLDYQYHRALMVISPRSCELQMARAAGTPALLGLAERLLWQLGREEQARRQEQIVQAAAAQAAGAAGGASAASASGETGAAASAAAAAGGPAGSAGATGASGAMRTTRTAAARGSGKAKSCAEATAAPAAVDAAAAGPSGGVKREPQPAERREAQPQQAASAPPALPAAPPAASASAATTVQLQHNLQQALLQAALALSDSGREAHGRRQQQQQLPAWFYDCRGRNHSTSLRARQRRRAERAAVMARLLHLATSPRVLQYLSPQEAELVVVQVLHVMATMPGDHDVRGGEDDSSGLIAAVLQATAVVCDTAPVAEALAALAEHLAKSRRLGEVAGMVAGLASRPAVYARVRAVTLEQVGTLAAMRDLDWEGLGMLAGLLWPDRGGNGGGRGGGGRRRGGRRAAAAAEASSDDTDDDDLDASEEEAWGGGAVAGGRKQLHRRQQRDCFATAVLAHVHAHPAEGHAHLEELLGRAPLQAAARGGDAAVRRLLEARETELRRRTAGGAPAEGWRMPEAHLVGYPQVEAFLRGPAQSETFHGLFHGLHEARAWVRQHFPYPGGETGAYAHLSHARNQQLHHDPAGYGVGAWEGRVLRGPVGWRHDLPAYAARAEVGGKAKGVYVEVTKLPELQEQRLARFRKDSAELRKVAVLLSAGAGAAAAAAARRRRSGRSGGTAGEAKEKKENQEEEEERDEEEDEEEEQEDGDEDQDEDAETTASKDVQAAGMGAATAAAGTAAPASAMMAAAAAAHEDDKQQVIVDGNAEDNAIGGGSGRAKAAAPPLLLAQAPLAAAVSQTERVTRSASRAAHEGLSTRQGKRARKK
ncbi:hypothetical protein CHLRE_10g428000v5 [Chlamydomonas reinhardtii]|uniref:Fe2OG dioxygenase domain-containing protein n=1 Tax=Chlamydomonas reinhardtii TaxID=3055 RepID=A0A2K3D9M8_CHLRE|nr:uncharacterized protein CHLRE_10g428000v5 [Chlamydomonas reinhardtii]PNW77235.1 hypothetical protein CHLRE_10g428000v5 [Chlamydomonas reinhardtii]